MTLLGYSRQVAAYLAYWYIGLASVLYAMILLVGVTTVVCTTVLASDTQQHTVFALAMAQTVLLLAVKFYNPTARGNQLHASAATLESIIWLFRTRVGAFAVPQNQPSQATAALRAAMTSWHSEAVTGTDLLQTSLERKYPPGVYTHCQFEGTLGEFCFVVEALTDNRKRAVQEIRHGFAASGGSLGTSGSVMWCFDERGVVKLAPTSKGEDAEARGGESDVAIMPEAEFFDVLFEEALEAGALDVEQMEEGSDDGKSAASHSVICAPSDLAKVTRAVRAAAHAEGYQVLSSDFEYLPKSTVLVEGGGGDAADKFDAIYDALEGCDDVQTVFHNVEFQY